MVWRRWGAGPAVVLLHGGYGSWSHWARTVPALRSQVSVFAPDLPGMGESDVPDQPHDIEHIAEIVASGLDLVLPPPVPVRLVGFSFGATVAGYMLKWCGKRLDRLIMIGSPAGAPANEVSSRMIRWRSVQTLSERREIHRHNLATLMFADPERIDNLAIEIQMRNAERTRVRSREISKTAELYGRLQQTPPRHLAAIWGSEDALLKGNEDRRITALREVDLNCRVRAIPGAGHWVQYEAAEATNAALLGLLLQ